MTEEQVRVLKEFGLFLAEEFAGSMAGEWRCPPIGAESAAAIVEAIAALKEQDAVQLLKELRAWHRSEYQANRDLDKRVDEFLEGR